MLINEGQNLLKIFTEDISQFMKLISSEINQYIFETAYPMASSKSGEVIY